MIFVTNPRRNPRLALLWTGWKSCLLLMGTGPLMATGLLATTPEGVETAPSDGGPQIALTFDDAPRGDGPVFTGEARTAALIEALDRAGVDGAMIFANSARLDESGTRRLTAYAEAGHPIANHSHSHGSVDSLGAEAFLEDVQKAHGLLSALPGYAPYFRFPYLREGRTAPVRDAVRRGLESMGLKQGYVTVDNYDWHLQTLMGQAMRTTGTLDLEGWKRFYLDVLLGAVEFYDAQAHRHLGRSPRHVLLLHENDLAALFIDDLVEALESRGWEIISADMAYQDPMAQQVPDTLFLGQGRVAALAHAGGAAARQLIHPLESEAALRAEAVRRGLLPVTEDAYLGQPRPGLVPRKFAPDQVSLDGRYEYGSVFSADGREMFYGVALEGRAEIHRVTLGEDGEVVSEILLEHPERTFGDPMLSPDESRLYFITDLHAPELKSMDIGHVRRTRSGWSAPELLPAPINTPFNEYYASFTLDGTLAFSTDRDAETEGDVDLVWAHGVEGLGVEGPGVEGPGTVVVEPLEGGLNTKAYEADPFIARDGSYLIFASNRRAGRDRDLYISFRKPDESWGEAILMGESINTPFQELCPFVTVDGQFLVYTHKQDIHWVSADVIDILRERFVPIEE